jgi:RNA polymerase sigma-70 factor (ECF subfamily)
MAEVSTPGDFEQWLTVIRPRLRRIARSIVKDYSSAEDVVQDTLIGIWKIHEQGNIRDLSAYAARAAWVNAIKYRARRKRWISLDPEILEENGITEPAAPWKDEEVMPWVIEDALSGLPPLQQAVIRLRYYSGLSFREIGRSLGISMNTAASRFRYAIARLKGEFMPDGKKEK